MITMQPGHDIVTVVVVFTVPADQQAGFLRELERLASDYFRYDGFIGCAIHRSEDGVRILEYIQWQSRAHFQAMLTAQAADGLVNQPPFPADVHVYEVTAVVER